MSNQKTRDFHRRRAAQERALANTAQLDAIRNIHLEMAGRYDDLARADPPIGERPDDD